MGVPRHFPYMPIRVGDDAVIAAPTCRLSGFQKCAARGHGFLKGAINGACSAMILRQAKSGRGARLRFNLRDCKARV